MNKLNRLLLALVSVVFMLAIVTAPPVTAREDKNDADVTTSSDDTSADDPVSGSPKSSRNDEIKRLENTYRQRGKSLLLEARENHRAKTAGERQAACERRKNGLQRKTGNLIISADKYFNRVSNVFAKAQEYHQANNLNIANYSELVAAANASKASAQASVEALNNLKPVIDCTTGTLADDIAVLKAAAQQTRTDLRVFKENVKALLLAIKAGTKTTGTGRER